MKNDVKVGLVIGLVFVTALIVFLWNQNNDAEPQVKAPELPDSFQADRDAMTDALAGREAVGTTAAADRVADPVPAPANTTTDTIESVDSDSLVDPGTLDKSSETTPMVKADDAKPEKPQAARYVVKKGDTLWSIAESFYGDGRKSNLILAANKSRIPNPNRLSPNMELVIPAEQAKPTLLTIENRPEKAAAGARYKVKKGDTLWGISKQVYGDGKYYRRIATANHIAEDTKLRVGTELVIPAKP